MIGLCSLIGCRNDQPKTLSGKIEIIEVQYINWACDCADYIETKYFKSDSIYEILEEDCIFIEPANKDLKMPYSYFRKDYHDFYLKLKGQFYEDKGIPDSYERKVPELQPQKAKVFHYDSYEYVKKD